MKKNRLWIVLSISMSLALTGCVEKGFTIKDTGNIPLFPEAQSVIMEPATFLNSEVPFTVTAEEGDWSLVEQGIGKGWLPSWFLTDTGLRPLEYISDDPMTLTQDTEGVSYPGGPGVVELPAGKLLTPLIRWEDWYFVRIIVYDVPAVLYAWVPGANLASPQDVEPTEGYLLEGTKVYPGYDFPDLKVDKPITDTYEVEVYIDCEQDGYVRVNAAGGWVAWVKKKDVHFKLR